MGDPEKNVQAASTPQQSGTQHNTSIQITARVFYGGHAAGESVDISYISLQLQEKGLKMLCCFAKITELSCVAMKAFG